MFFVVVVVVVFLLFVFFFGGGGSDTIFKEQLQFNRYMFRYKLQNINGKVESEALNLQPRIKP